MRKTSSTVLKSMCLKLPLFLSALLVTGFAIAGLNDDEVNRPKQLPSQGYTKPSAGIWLKSSSHVLIAGNAISSVDVELETSELVDSVSVRVQSSEGLNVVNGKDVWELAAQDPLHFTLQLSAGEVGQYYLDLTIAALDSKGHVQSKAVSVSVMAVDDIKSVDNHTKQALAKKALKPSGQLMPGDDSTASTAPVKVFKAQESSL